MSTDRKVGQGTVPAELPDLDGEADFGEMTRTLYATDASIYRVDPPELSGRRLPTISVERYSSLVKPERV